MATLKSSAFFEKIAFVSHCSASFQPILDCFTPNFKLKYEDSENIKADCVDTIVCNLHQIKHRAFFSWDTGTFILVQLWASLCQWPKRFMILDIDNKH